MAALSKSRKLRRFSPEQIANVYYRVGCCFADAADVLGVSRRSMSRVVRETPELQRLIGEKDDLLVDIAEGQLLKALNHGEPWAVQFALKTKGKDRGYTERTESHVVKDTRKVVVKLSAEDAARLHGRLLSEC